MMKSAAHLNTDKKKKTSGLLKKSFRSYVIVLLLPLLIFTFYCINSYSALKEKTYAGQHLILENTAEQLDAVLLDVNRLVSHLQLNRYAAALSNPNPSPYTSVPMNNYYLKQDLAPLQVTNSYIQEINLYFSELNYIINTSSAYNRSLLDYMTPNNNTLSAADWEFILTALPSKKRICFYREGKSFLALAMPLAADSGGRPLSVICVQIDLKLLQNILVSRLPSDYSGDFILINGETVLLSTGGSLPDALPPVSELLAHFAAHPDAGIYQANPHTVVDYCSMQYPDMALLFFADSSGFHATVYHTLEIMLLSLLVCTLLGLMVIMYLSRKNYEPVSQILHFMRGTGAELDPESDEYRMIMKMLVENRNEIEKQRELLKNNYLQKIFTGEIDFSQISDPIARQFSLDSFSSFLCVVQFSVEEASESESISDLTFFIIRNVYQEILAESFPDVYFSAQKRNIAALIRIPTDSGQPLGRVEQLTGQLIRFLSDTFRLSLKAGISGLQDREHIPDAYLQAGTALQYQILFETGDLCLFDAIPQKQTISSIPLNTSDYVINLVTQGMRSQLQEYFNTLNRELKKSVLSWQDARSCYYFFYQVTAKLQYYCQSQYGVSLEALSFLTEDFFAQSLPKAIAQACSAYLEACDEIAERRLSAVQWGRNICRYIENNYFDANLNLNSISTHFQISSSYLSRKFREQYQKSVVDYLYEVRVANALPLLENADLKIADVAQMTGFVDSNAFIRIFKKLKGITPGKYSQTILVKPVPEKGNPSELQRPL